jgi:hypothetical protein
LRRPEGAESEERSVADPITIENLSKTYPGGNEALRDRAARGETVGLRLDPAGCHVFPAEP